MDSTSSTVAIKLGGIVSSSSQGSAPQETNNAVSSAVRPLAVVLLGIILYKEA